MTSAKVILTAAQRHISNFMEEFYEPNMLWLLEVHHELKKIVNSTEVLLPRTPSGKRKFVDVDKANALHQASTFHEGAENKKIKIEDLSTIVDVSNSNLTLNNTSRPLRQRKPKVTAQPIKRSRRVAAKNKDDNVKSIVVSQDFIPPANIDNITLQASNNTTLQINSVGKSLSIQLQPPNILAMKMTPHKTPIINAKGKTGIEDANVDNLHKNIEVHIDFVGTPDEVKQKQRNSNTQEILTSDTLVKDSIIDPQISGHAACGPGLVNDTMELVSAQHVFASTPERTGVKLFGNNNPLDTSCIPVCVEGDIAATAELSRNNQLETSSIPVCIEGDIADTADLSGNNPLDTSCIPVCVGDIAATADLSGSNPLDTSCIPVCVEGDLAAMDVANIPTDQEKDEKDEKEDNNCEQNAGRRDTYRTMVGDIIDGHPKKPLSKVDSNKPSVCADGDTNKCKDVKKGPKITKPIKPGGNVVSNIKSFLKRPASPRMETGTARGITTAPHVNPSYKRPDSPKLQGSENQAAKRAAERAAEFQRKELIRQHNIKEGQKKKQKEIDEKKKVREERERNFAEQQQRILEEIEIKRQFLEKKDMQIERNKDELRKVREQEDKQRKAIRDNKQADREARRQKDDDEHRRKAAELLRDQRRKEEALQRKYVNDEQIRLKKKAEKEVAEKDKLRQAEENRILDEERKKKGFEEREKHRLEVQRKKEEEREKDRIERQVREERNKQAEKEIMEAKKREEERLKVKEEERQRATHKLREEIKEKFKHDYTGTTVMDVPSVLRSSPRLKIKYNGPCVPLVQRDSAYVSYGIDDLSSGDSTDDESEPANRVPSWAQGSRLTKQLTRQFYTKINPDDIFIDCMETLRLDKIFCRNKKIYFTRSSSAHWNSPPVKNKGAAYKFHK